MISVVIPVYNGSNYIKSAIESALAQTYPHIEIIVVNDGSTDDTDTICRSYGDKIRYYKKENGGVSTALNFGIKNMCGEYFSWLSHDDTLYPEKIEKQIKALERCGDMRSIVFGDYDILNEDTGSVFHYRLNEYFPEQLLTDSVFPVVHEFLGGCDLLIHKSHFNRVGMFDETLRYTQDYDMWLRLLNGQKSVYVNSPLYMLRTHSEQGSRTFVQPMRAEEQSLWEKYNLSDSDKSKFFGSVSGFNFEMFARFKASGADVPMPSESHKKPSFFDGEKCVCIFGAGAFGLRLYYMVLCYGVNVSYFVDNNKAKQGKIIAGDVMCIPVETLSYVKDKTLVIVANRCPDNIVHQLHNMRFPFVTTKQAVDFMIFSDNQGV